MADIVNQTYTIVTYAVQSSRSAKPLPQSAGNVKDSAINHGRNADLETGLGLELLAWRNCFTHEDRKNLMTAFVNKQK